MRVRGTPFVAMLLLASTCLARAASPKDSAPAPLPACDLAAATPWISGWLAAWDLTSRDILRLPDAPPPTIVFFDTTCVYTNSAVAAGGARARKGPALRGRPLEWRVATHGDSLTLPNGKHVEVALLSFTSSDKVTGPFFVMAAPSYWERAGHGEEPGLTAVFLHEFTHTRQVRGMGARIAPIDATWKGEKDLDDDAVQNRFGKDSTYVAEYLAERELFYRAADAASPAQARALAAEALARLRSRRARWFTGADSVYVTLDDVFLSMEGAAQWAATAWLAHPKGGRMTKDAAVAFMLGNHRWWVQDEGLAIFLAIDRLLPGWQSMVFRDPSAGVLELLEKATRS